MSHADVQVLGQVVCTLCAAAAEAGQALADYRVWNLLQPVRHYPHGDRTLAPVSVAAGDILLLCTGCGSALVVGPISTLARELAAGQSLAGRAADRAGASLPAERVAAIAAMVNDQVVKETALWLSKISHAGIAITIPHYLALQAKVTGGGM